MIAKKRVLLMLIALLVTGGVSVAHACDWDYRGLALVGAATVCFTMVVMHPLAYGAPPEGPGQHFPSEGQSASSCTSSSTATW